MTWWPFPRPKRQTDNAAILAALVRIERKADRILQALPLDRTIMNEMLAAIKELREAIQ